MENLTLQDRKIIITDMIIRFTKKIGREKKTRQTLFKRTTLRKLIEKKMLENIPLPEDSAYESYEVWLKTCVRREKYNMTVLKNIQKAKSNVWVLEWGLRKLEEEIRQEKEKQVNFFERLQAVGQNFSFEKDENNYQENLNKENNYKDRKSFGRNSSYEFSRGQVLFLRRKR
ncbi:MAG: hypothetical protein ACRCSK_00865 [Fusobacteriaceae bacterium]